jgi:hypothetical protein
MVVAPFQVPEAQKQLNQLEKQLNQLETRPERQQPPRVAG